MTDVSWREPATGEDMTKINCDNVCSKSTEKLKLENGKNGTKPLKIEKGNDAEIKAYPGGKEEVAAMKKQSQDNAR